MSPDASRADEVLPDIDDRVVAPESRYELHDGPCSSKATPCSSRSWRREGPKVWQKASQRAEQRALRRP